MKKWTFLTFSVVLISIAMVTTAYAKYPGSSGMHGKSSHHKGLSDMIFYKAKAFLNNQDVLGLSDEQINSIKIQKHSVKKMLIQRDAEIALVKADVKHKLYENPIDVEAVNKLVEQKYELKKAKAQALVQEMAKLKATLTIAQYDQMKKIWREKSK